MLFNIDLFKEIDICVFKSLKICIPALTII